jgi:shikimate kinase
MEHYKNIGKVIYLKVDMDVLTKRLSDVKQRGVVMREGQSLVSLYNERSVLYEKYADITIDEKTKSMEEVVADLLGAIG